jgi:hypothetical protein
LCGEDTPGSEVDALMNDERHNRDIYANVIGNAGEYSVQIYRPLVINIV